MRLCRGAGSVLELGSGYGRLLRQLAAPTRRVVGLEIEPSFLTLARAELAELPTRSRESVTLLRADMQSFSLAQPVERVLLPYNSLFCLLTPRAVERCFRRVRAALVPGGLFAFDVWNADRLLDDELAPDAAHEEVAQFEHDGRVWRAFERCRRGRSAQRLDVTYTYVPSGRAAQRSQTVQQRYYRSAELLGLLHRCGFVVQQKLGSFAGARFHERATRLIVTARLAPVTARPSGR